MLLPPSVSAPPQLSLPFDDGLVKNSSGSDGDGDGDGGGGGEGGGESRNGEGAAGGGEGGLLPAQPTSSSNSAGSPSPQLTSSPAMMGALVPPSSDPYCCPLTGFPFKEPVVAADGYTYERAELAAWVLLHGRFSPISGEPISGVLLANFTLMDAARKRRAAATRWPTASSLRSAG